MFGIDVTKDSSEFHSQFMCHKRKAKISTWNRRKSLSCLQSARDVASSSSSLWCDFNNQNSVSECSVCPHRLFVLAKGVAGVSSDSIDTDRSALQQPHDCVPLNENATCVGIDHSNIPHTSNITNTETFGESQTDTVEDIAERTGSMENRVRNYIN